LEVHTQSFDRLNDEMLILASTSERRITLLKLLVEEFKVIKPKASEELIQGKPIDTVLRNSELKALSVLEDVESEDLVLAADTVVSVHGKILGKPKDHESVREYLELLSGKWHYVYTGISLAKRSSGIIKQDYEVTAVKFRRLSQYEIYRYLVSHEPIGKAGGYAIQGLGASLIEEIRGCYTNVIGLPLPLVKRLLSEVGYLS